jgi:hypothetical protein
MFFIQISSVSIDCLIHQDRAFTSLHKVPRTEESKSDEDVCDFVVLGLGCRNAAGLFLLATAQLPATDQPSEPDFR